MVLPGVSGAQPNTAANNPIPAIAGIFVFLSIMILFKVVGIERMWEQVRDGKDRGSFLEIH